MPIQTVILLACDSDDTPEHLQSHVDDLMANKNILFFAGRHAIIGAPSRRRLISPMLSPNQIRRDFNG